MAPCKTKNKHNTKEKWRLHDTYQTGPSCNRIVTRSQSVFLRVRNTPSDLDLFADSSRHQPPNKPPLMETLKGEFGSIPRTIITRSFGKHVKIDNNLCNNLDSYKNAESKTKEYEKTDRSKQIEDKSVKLQGKTTDTSQKGGKVVGEVMNNESRQKHAEDEESKERQAQEEEEKKKKQVEEEKRKQAEEEENFKRQAEENEKGRIKAEENEKKRIQAEENEKKRIQDEENEKKRIQVEENEKKRIQAEEAQIKKKQDDDEENNKKEQVDENEKEADEEENKEGQDGEDYNRERSGSFFGGRLSLRSLGNIFGFGSKEKFEES